MKRDGSGSTFFFAGTIACILILLPAMKVHAQDAENACPYTNFEDCKNNFNVANSLSNASFRRTTQLQYRTLVNYFNCRAAALNDIGECNGLYDQKTMSNEDVQKCRYHYMRTVGFYALLLLQKQVTPEVLKNCPITAKSAGVTDCKQFAEGFLTGDDSVCKENKDCKAVIKLDPSLTNSRYTADIIYFIQAIKDGESKKCQRIKDPNMARECKAYMERDVDLCNQDSEFLNIRNQFCTTYCQ